MPSAKQIKARKAFAKKYAKKGKRKPKSKKRQDVINHQSKATTEDYPKGTTIYGRNLAQTRTMLKKEGAPDEMIDEFFSRKWDKKMKEFLNKSNNES
jgi:hypothetical protein